MMLNRNEHTQLTMKEYAQQLKAYESRKKKQEGKLAIQDKKPIF